MNVGVCRVRDTMTNMRPLGAIVVIVTALAPVALLVPLYVWARWVRRRTTAPRFAHPIALAFVAVSALVTILGAIASARAVFAVRVEEAADPSTKARVLAEASKLDGEELIAYLEREAVKLAEYEQWRIALDEGGPSSVSTNRRIRELERELARKEKALAEAAALLILKKKWSHSTGGTRTTT